MSILSGRHLTDDKQERRGTGALMRALEPRIMFDGAVSVTVADAAPAEASHADAVPDNSVAEALVAVTATAPEASEQRHEIVFVDASVKDYQSLLAGIGAGTEVVLIQPDSNGLQQIADALAGRSGIDAIHILSHGDTGKIQIGDAWVDSNSLATHQALLSTIGSALSENGDILLYGCRVAENGAGTDFVRALSDATGADVAASDDMTGAASRQGDWDLEFRHGGIESAALVLDDFAGLLTAFSDNMNNAGGTGSSLVRTLGGVSYTFTFTSQGDGGDLAYESQFGSGNSASMSLMSSGPNTGTTERMTITRTDLADFTFTSIYLDNTNTETVFVAGYLNGSIVGSAQSLGTGSGTLNFGGIQVDEVRITSTDFFGLAIDDFAGDTDPPLSAPTLTATGVNPSFLEGGSAVDLFSSVTANTNDSGQTFSGMTMTVTNVSNGASEVLSIGGTNVSLNNGNSGTLTGIGNYSVSVVAGTATVTLFGMTRDNTQMGVLVDGITYSNSHDNPGSSSRVVTITGITDSGGSNNTAAPNRVSTVTMTPVNDAPTASATGGTPTYTENGSAVDLFSGVSISTIESGQSIDQLVFTVTNVSDGSSEVLGADGSNIGLVNGASGTTTTNGMSYSVSVSTGTATVTLSKAGGISAAAAQTLVDGMSYRNNSDTPNTSNRVVTLTSVRDNGGTSNGGVDTASVSIAATVTVVAANDAPVATASGGTTAFSEASDVTSTPVVVDAALTLSDVDNSSFASATVSITGGLQSAQDVLSFTNDGSTMGNITASYTSGTGVLSLSSAGASATVAQWQAALRSVTYSNSSDTPNTTTRTISFVVNDGTTDSSATTKSVSVAAGNDSPSVAVPATITVTEDTATALTGISFSDPDAGSSSVTATLAVGSGTLAATSGGGVTVGGSGTGSLTLTGSIANINTFIAGSNVTFTTASNATSNVTLTTSINDAGNTGAGGAKSDSDTTTLQVTAVNDRPDITAPGSIAVTEDVATALTGISFSDVDAGSGSVTVTLSTGSGTLAATPGGGVTVAGSGTNSMTLTGSIANINTFISGSNASFTTASNATSNVTLTVSIDDGGNTGVDPGTSGTGSSEARSTTVTLSVSVVNDAPVNSAPSTQTMQQDGVLVFSSGNGNLISISDVDVGGGTLRVTLTASNGLLTLGGTTGLSFSVGSGTGDATMTFDGSITDINNALVGLSFAPTSGYNGAASIQITSNDLGFSGSGGSQTDTDTINITVNPNSPLVTSVSASSANGGYKIGDTVLLTVTFDRVVNVDTTGGTPTLLLETGSIDRQASYVSGSGTNTLSFSYVVQAGDVAADLDYQSTGALALNGGTIQDAGSLNAVLTLPTLAGPNSIAGQKAIVIDGVRPTASIVVADTLLGAGETSLVTITFNEAVSGLTSSDFIVANGTLGGLSSADGGITWTATLTPATSVYDTSNLVTLDNTGVQDARGNVGSGTTDSNNYGVDSIAPINTVPATQVTNTITPLVFGSGNGNAITVSESGSLSVVVSAASGTLTVSASGTAGISNNGSGSVTITGTAAEVNAALEGMSYLPDAAGAQTISIQSTDAAGNVDNDTVTVNVSNSTLVVTSNLDTGADGTIAASFAADQADDGGLSVREALYWARGGDTVTFDLNGATPGNQGGTIVLNGTALDVVDHNLTIDGDLNDDGAADVTISGNNASRVMQVGSGSGVSGVQLTGLTLTQGNTFAGGGGLYIANGSTVTVRDSNITNNTDTGGGGGGIHATASTLTVINSTVSGNTSNTFGGGIRVVSNNGQLNLINSTVSGNTTTGTGAHGGGIQFGGSLPLTIVNSTISGNAALGSSSFGGGLRVTSGTAFIYNSTIVGNASTSSGGGVNASGTETIVNTVVAGNTSGAGAAAGVGGSPLATGGSADDVGGTVETATSSYFGSNVTITTNNASLNNQGTSNLLLGNLGYNNGGHHLTHRPQLGSALRDAGSNAALPVDSFDLDGDANTSEALPVDANGSARASNTVDIGAVEGNASPSIGNLNGDAVTFTQGAAAVLLDAGGNATVGDADTTIFNGGNVTVSIVANGVAGEDVLSIRHEGNAAGQIGVSGSNVSYGGVVIGSFTGGSGGANLVVTLNGNASHAATQALVRNLSYADTNLSNGIGQASRTVRVTVNDGSGGVSSNADVTVAIQETTPPTATIVVTDTALAVGETSLVTITFSEAVTGFTNADLSVANGTLSAVSSADGGITWTATFTPTASIEDSSNLITLDNTGVADAAGNTGTGTTDSNNYAIDTQRPTVSIVVADTALAAGETSGVTITFSEAVTGLTTGDFSVANSTLSGLSTADGGVTWTATLIPTVSIEDASNLITLANTGVTDAAGNAGTGTTDSNNYAIDTQRPTVSIVVADTALAAGETSGVTITFSEAVTGLATGDFSVANGTLSGLSTADGGITWTATFTPTASIEDSSNLITLANTGVTDAAGNTGTGTTDSNNYAIDTLRPTASIVVADTVLAVGETSLVTITFSEAVTGFTNADLTVANGTLSAVSSADGGITWTATFTPTASIEDSSNLITLDNTGVADAAGNTGTGTTDSNNYAIDGVAPRALGLSTPATASATSLTYTMSFSEAVTGVDIGDFTLVTTGGISATLGGVTAVDAQTYAISITGIDGVGSVRLDLNASGTGISDLAGNALGAGLTGAVHAVDTTPPPPPPPVTQPPVVIAPPAPPPFVPPAPTPPIIGPALDPAPGSEPPSLILQPPSPSAPLTIAAMLAAPVPDLGGLTEPGRPNVGGASPAPYINVGDVRTTEALQAQPDLGAQVMRNDQPFNFSLPRATFASNDPNASITVEVRQLDGQPLPPWIRFDPVTGTLSGRPPVGWNRALKIEIVARDSKGNRASSVVEFDFRPPAAGPRSFIDLWQTPVASGEGEAPVDTVPQGRASLAEQFAQHGRAAQRAQDLALLEQLRTSARQRETETETTPS